MRPAPHRCAITCGAPSPLRCVELRSNPCSQASTLIWLRQMAKKEGLVRPAPHRCAITCGAPSPLRCVELRSNPCSQASTLIWLRQMAEKEGFEPPVPFPVQLISSQSHSATLPLLLYILQNDSECDSKLLYTAIIDRCVSTDKGSSSS